MRSKRGLLLGSYDTAANGWTLTEWKLGDAVPRTNFVDKPRGDGAWNLSTALTDGIPKYTTRPFTATLECSEGNRSSRKEKIDHMVNLLSGMSEAIVLPDDPDLYINGQMFQVVENYNTLAHASVTVTATCDPWKYRKTDKVAQVELHGEEVAVTLENKGRRPVVPTLMVMIGNSSEDVRLTYGGATLTLANGGIHQWPALLLTPGSHVLKVKGGEGSGVHISYREAVL